MRRTSGHKLEPPMPRRRTSLKPALQTSLARFRNSIGWAICSSVISNQPSHLASSSLVQSDASRCQSRCILPPLCHSAPVVFTAAASVSGSEDFKRLTRFVLFPPCFSHPRPEVCGNHLQTPSHHHREARRE